MSDWPNISIFPDVELSKPANKLSNVDFPEPDAPIIATLSAGLIVNPTSDKIVKEPSILLTVLYKFSTVIICELFFSNAELVMFKFFLLGIVLCFSSLTQAKSIVVLGDSISASYGFEAQQGWVALMQQKIQADYPSYTIYNESISGDTTAGGLARLPKIIKKYQPDILMLELGANDGLRGMSLTAMQKNLSAIIKKSKKSGAQVLLLSMRIPSNYGRRFTDMFYNTYQKLSTQHDIPVVPFILENVALNKSHMQRDGLHPNALAQPTITEHIYPYLLKLL